MKDRALALAGLLQAIDLVNRIAHTGSADGTALETILSSIFRIDASSTGAVYGEPALLKPGLHSLARQLNGTQREPALIRMALTVLYVERKLIRRPALIQHIQNGILETERQRQHWGITHPTVLARLGEIYASTISTLRPRVLVQGNPQYLSQSAVVVEIRALLLGAIRAAVLWRQLGGSYLDFLLHRRQIEKAVEAWLARI